MVEQITSLTSNMKAETFEPVISKGMATDEVYLKVDELADKILEKHKEIGIV